MIKATCSKLLLNSKSSRINSFSNSDNSKIDQFYENQIFSIYELNPMTTHWKFGKMIIAKVIDLQKDSPNINISIGTLNSIEQLVNSIEERAYKEVKKLYIREIEYGKSDIKSLNKIGINEDFECQVILDKDK